MNIKDIVVLSTAESLYLARLIASGLGAEMIETERSTFSDGERYFRFKIENDWDLFGRTAIVVGSTHTDECITEMYRVMFGLKEQGIEKRIGIMPFFGYSTMERATTPGELVTAKMIAYQFSHLPGAADNTFYLLDVHTPGLVHYFEGDCMRYETSAMADMIHAINMLGTENLVIATADMSRSKAVSEFAAQWNSGIALINKHRDREKTKILNVIGDVKGKRVIIYDDMTRTAGTIIDAVHAYLAHGAIEVIVVLSHFAVNGIGVIKKLHDAPIEKVIITNSHPMANAIPEEYAGKYVVLDQSDNFVSKIKKQLRLTA